MLSEIISLPATERKNIFLKAAYELGINEPLIVEKDFWVSWVLDKLFLPSNDVPSLIFKGGTSLSKGYHLIDRFSEDIDITIARKDLGFLEPDEEIIKLGSKRRKRYFENLHDETIHIVHQKILPSLKSAISRLVTDTWSLNIDPHDQECVVFHYPSCFTGIQNQYLLPTITLEFGSRGDVIPTENIALTSYVEKALPNLGIQSPTVTTLKPERTFWEKILILHKLAHQSGDQPIQGRLSRHYYDVMMLAKSDLIDQATENINLLKGVILHNMAYFRSAQAAYDTAIPGSIKLVPNDAQLKHLNDDYQSMKSMFILEPPTFTELMDKIKAIELSLNKISI